MLVPSLLDGVYIGKLLRNLSKKLLQRKVCTLAARNSISLRLGSGWKTCVRKLYVHVCVCFSEIHPPPYHNNPTTIQNKTFCVCGFESNKPFSRTVQSLNRIQYLLSKFKYKYIAHLQPSIVFILYCLSFNYMLHPSHCRRLPHIARVSVSVCMCVLL